jgi:hypothetical protein
VNKEGGQDRTALCPSFVQEAGHYPFEIKQITQAFLDLPALLVGKRILLLIVVVGTLLLEALNQSRGVLVEGRAWAPTSAELPLKAKCLESLDAINVHVGGLAFAEDPKLSSLTLHPVKIKEQQEAVQLVSSRYGQVKACRQIMTVQLTRWLVGDCRKSSMEHYSDRTGP